MSAARQLRQGGSRGEADAKVVGFHRHAEAVVIKIAITTVAYDAIRLTLPQ